MENKSKLKWGTYYEMGAMQFGITCGAGMAAGTYAIGYFAKYGGGHLFPFVTIYALVQMVCIFLSLNFIRAYKVYDYNHYYLALYACDKEGSSKALRMGVSVYFDVFTSLVTVIGLSSNVALFGTLFHMVTGLPVIAGSAISCLLYAWLAIYGADFLRKLNGLITLALLICMTIVLAAVIVQQGDVLSHLLFNFEEGTDWSGESLGAGYNAVFSYACLSLTGGANLCNFAQKIENKVDSFLSAVAAAVMYVFLFLLTSMICLPYLPAEITNSSAILTICSQYLGSKVFAFVYWVIVLFSMFSTAPAITYNLANRWSGAVKSEKYNERKKLFFFSILANAAAFVCSFMGLMAIVTKGYSYLGKIALPCIGIPLFISVYRIVKKDKAEKEI